MHYMENALLLDMKGDRLKELQGKLNQLQSDPSSYLNR